MRDGRSDHSTKFSLSHFTYSWNQVNVGPRLLDDATHEKMPGESSIFCYCKS